MLKIAKVISVCNKCEFCIYAKSVSDNHSHFELCNAPDVAVFVLEQSNDNIKHYDINIPDNCPLEDYKEIEK